MYSGHFEDIEWEVPDEGERGVNSDSATWGAGGVMGPHADMGSTGEIR